MGDLPRPEAAKAFPPSEEPDNGEAQAEAPAEQPEGSHNRTEKPIDLEEPREDVKSIKLELPKPGNIELVQIELLATMNKQLSTIIGQNDKLLKALGGK